MPKQITDTTKKIERLRTLVGAVLLSAVLSLVSIVSGPRPVAEAAVSNTINFQARLMQSNGALVPDGYYNVQFKLYNVSSAGSALWTETYYDSNGATAGNDNRLRVSNGYLTVSLNSLNDNWGSITSWDQELWLTMNIGGATQTATPTWDGEMNPRLKLTAVPYAMQAKSAESLSKISGVNTSTLNWANQTASNAILLPDAAGTICLQGNAACGFMTGNTSDFIQNGTSVQTANFNISGTGWVGNLRTQDVDANGVPLSLGTTDATAVNIGKYGRTTYVQGSLSVAETASVERGLQIGITLEPLSFTTPLGTSVTSRLVIPVHNPGAFNQIIALGLSSTATTSSRVISLFDARGAGDNQAPLSIFSPDETSVFGLGWDGQNNEGYLKTIGAKGIGIKVNSHVAMSIGGTNGNAIFRNQNNTTSGFAVQNAVGDTLLNINTLNSGITLGASTTVTAGNSLTITGGATGTRPASPAEGMMYFDTTTKQLLTYSNGKWQADKSDAILVAASDSSQADKDAAQYIADGDTAAAADGDQVQINQALAAGAGKKVVLLAGTYTADATILVPNNTALAGVGTGTLIKLADIDATDNLIENSDTTTGTGVIIRDLKLDGQKSLNTAGTQRAVYLNGMGDGTGSTARQGAELAGLRISEFRNEAIYLNNSDGLTLRSNVLQSSGVAIYVASSSNNALTGNTVLGGDVTLTASTNNSLAGNVVTGGGIHLLSSSGKNTATGNVIRGATGDGFVINGSADNTVTGNVMESNGQAGIYLTVAVGNTITGNAMTGNANFGVYATSTSTDNTISGNKISGNYYGILISNNSARNLLSGNTITNNGGSTRNQAIVLEDADMNTIDGNAISDTSATTTNDAIEIKNSTSDNNYLSNNTLGTGSINDAGTGTIYANQINSSGVLLNRSSGGLAVQNTSGQNLISASPSGNTVQLGQSSALSGSLTFANATNNNTVKIQSGTTSASYTLTLPTALGASGSCLADTTGTGVLGFTACASVSGATTVGTIDSQAKAANGAVISGSTIYLQTADATNVGLVSTGTQTFAGAKTFNSSVTIAANQSLVLNGGITGTRPASPTEGMMYFDTTTKQLLTYSNGKWQADSKGVTFVVAAFDSSQAAKDAAHYVANGEDSAGSGIGVLDGDQVQINQALDAAEALGGGTVYLTEGTFTVDEAIAVPNKVTLRGSGVSTIVQLGNFGATSVTIDAIKNKDQTTGEQVTVQDMQLNGRKSVNTAGTQYGFQFINVGGSSGATIRNGVVVSGVHIKDFRTGNGRIATSMYSRVTNSSFVGSGAIGLLVNASPSKNTIENSVFDSNATQGLYFSSATNNVVKSSAITNNTSHGIYVTGSNNNVFENNTISGNGDRGIVLLTASTSNIMTGNSVTSNASNGIQIQGSTYNSVSDNTISDNTSIGVVLNSNAHNNNVSDNVISGNLGTYGIRVESGSNNNQLAGNLLRDNGGTAHNNAVSINVSDYTVVTNNSITDSTSTSTNFAIWISAASSNGYLSGNTLGSGTISDSGTGTIYANQINSSGVLTNRSGGGLSIQNSSGQSLLVADATTSAVDITGTLKVQSDAAGTFLVQNSSSTDLFRVNASTNQVVVGVSGSSPTLFVLGGKTTSGDPTGTDGAIYFNSATQRFRCYSNGSWKNCSGSGYETLELEDEFMGGYGDLDSGTFVTGGSLGWLCEVEGPAAGGCNYSYLAEETNRPGMLVFSNESTTTGMGGLLQLRPIDPAMVERQTFIIKSSSSTYRANTKLQIGFVQDELNPGDTPASGVYFSYDAGVSANWQTVTRTGGVSTTNTTTTAVADSTWYRLDIVRNSSGNWEFYLNGTLQFTHTTNKPTAFQLPAINTVNRGANYAEVFVDYFSLRSKVITR